MDAVKVLRLLELIDKAKVPPPGWSEGEPLPERNLAIIAKAEAEIDAEVATA